MRSGTIIGRTEINDELDDLEPGHPLLPPDADAASRLEVVPVHDDVHGQVECDGNPGHSGRAEELGVAQDGGGTVVVAVKEGCDNNISYAPRILLAMGVPYSTASS